MKCKILFRCKLLFFIFLLTSSCTIGKTELVMSKYNSKDISIISVIANPEYVSAKTENESDQIDLDAATEAALLKNLREISHDILDLIKDFFSCPGLYHLIN